MLNRIQELRIKNGWKQKELAAMLNTTQQAIGHYETGRRGIDAETVCRLCDVFGCTADYLLCRSARPALFRNQQVVCSSHITSSTKNPETATVSGFLVLI